EIRGVSTLSSPRRRGPILRSVPLAQWLWVPALASLGRDDGRVLLRRFRFVPQRVHLGERRFLRRLAARGQRAFDGAKTPLELGVGGAQHGSRIGVEMAGEVDQREQEVADFGR